ncbi:MAG TPA: hypothetical protein VNN22_21845 [Verrucomicrobiae bacterium]|nr:hypothetical protein [Verrucomicrobiae bacterium]
MTRAESIAEFAEQPTLPAVTWLLAEQTREMVAKTSGFRRWTREHLLQREPSPAELQQHAQICKWLIRLLRLEQMALDEPDFPDKSLAEEVAFAIRGLKSDWEMLHNPMPEAEAGKLIPDLFAA